MSAGEEFIDMDAVVDEVRRRGFFAYVEQTGGGCATIYAGSTVEVPDWGPRYAACAGPGWFVGGWGTGSGDAQGDPADFYVGPDDDGGGEADRVDPGDWSTRSVADLVVKHIREHAHPAGESALVSLELLPALVDVALLMEAAFRLTVGKSPLRMATDGELVETDVGHLSVAAFRAHYTPDEPSAGRRGD